MDVEKVRDDFPLLKKRRIVYMDSACTSLKPQKVINAVDAYYSVYSGCAGRSAHDIAIETERKMEEAREKTSRFIGGKKEEIVFTRNATEGINLIAKTIDFSRRSKVVLTNMEHHSALLPFLNLSLQKKIQTDFLIADDEGLVNDLEKWKEKIDSKTALVVVHHTTNTTGTTAPLKEIAKIAHDAGAMVLVDGAQGVPHYEVSVSSLGVDFLAFSGHKMLGPTGIGVLFAKQFILETLPPFLLGGETVEEVKLDSFKLQKPPHRFEAGIQHYSGIIGLGAAVDYLQRIGMKKIEEHEKELARELIETVSVIEGITLYGPTDFKKKCAILAFNVKKLPSQEVAVMLNRLGGIATRAGFFCAQPAMEHLGAKHGALRASLYLYNTKEEIEKLGEALGKIAGL
ncbi:cysteine desulfurase [Candidatus Micrarchaeota archaeon]|nr:cysteine desulfurase [Candidatus Micrarchaeota archaeon]